MGEGLFLHGRVFAWPSQGPSTTNNNINRFQKSRFKSTGYSSSLCKSQWLLTSVAQVKTTVMSLSPLLRTDKEHNAVY